MRTQWRLGLPLALATAALGCGQDTGKTAPAYTVQQGTPAPAEDPVKGYPGAPGSAQALERLARAQEGLAPRERIATILRYADAPAGVKLLEAERARLKQAPADILALTATVRAKAPRTALAASALSIELATLRPQQSDVFLSRCKEVLDAPDSSEADRAVALYTRAFHYRDAGRAKAGVLDALRFCADYPDKVRRMKAAGRLAGLVRDAGFLCEADMLEGSDQPEIVAQALMDEFAPFEYLLAGIQTPDTNRSCLSAYLAHAPNLEAIEAAPRTAEATQWESAKHLGRIQRLVAYGGNLDRTVDVCREYRDLLRGLIEKNALPDDALPFAYAQLRATTECLRRLLLDPHFVRSAAAHSSGSSASMRSEQVLGDLSLLSLDTAERRFD
ncbi:MAG: hypothetical protein RBU21_16090, partial [FCB group bacterium]|nr:hypothetical protein [FCB group bacterium]